MEEKIIEKNKKNKIAIMGFAPSWVETPFDDPDFEIWTLNEAYKLFDKAKNFRMHRCFAIDDYNGQLVAVPGNGADLWVEIHDVENSPTKKIKEHVDFLRTCPVPVYMRKKYREIPSSIAFPYEQIQDWLKQRGHVGYRFFTNSISWMIALAIYLEYKEIHIYGVDMAQDEGVTTTSEYALQRPSCTYMIGVAEKYATVYVPPSSDLFLCNKLYGFESDNTSCIWFKKQIRELQERTKKYMQEEQGARNAALQAQMAQAELRGAISAYSQSLKRRL